MKMDTPMTRFGWAIAATVVLAGATQLPAQGIPAASSTKGFFVGANLNQSSVTIDDPDSGTSDTESGAGLGVQAGFGFTPRIAFVVDLTGARIDSDGEEFTLGHFDLMVRYAFTGVATRFVPSLEVGYSGVAMMADDVSFDGTTTGDLTFSGTGFTLGAGVQYYMSPSFALGLGAKWTSGEFDEIEYAGESMSGLGVDMSSTRFNIGFTWYPMAGR
jgi:opacity protein-like surface antigen